MEKTAEIAEPPDDPAECPNSLRSRETSVTSKGERVAARGSGEDDDDEEEMEEEEKEEETSEGGLMDELEACERGSKGTDGEMTDCDEEATTDEEEDMTE